MKITSALGLVVFIILFKWLTPLIFHSFQGMMVVFFDTVRMTLSVSLPPSISP